MTQAQQPEELEVRGAGTGAASLYYGCDLRVLTSSFSLFAHLISQPLQDDDLLENIDWDEFDVDVANADVPAAVHRAPAAPPPLWPVQDEDNGAPPADTPPCLCNAPSLLLTTRNGTNAGRDFFKCASQDDAAKCDYFHWRDELGPPCGCNRPSTLRKVNKAGQNQGTAISGSDMHYRQHEGDSAYR